MTTTREINEGRASNARTINEAIGEGAADGTRLAQDWRVDRDGYDRAIELLANPGLTAWYAQQNGKFAGVDERDSLYRAGWDVGFGAALLRGAAAIREHRPDGWY